MVAKSRKKTDPTKAPLERLYGILEKHLTSLPEKEATQRLEAIDAVHSRLLERDSKIHASPRKSPRLLEERETNMATKANLTRLVKEFCPRRIEIKPEQRQSPPVVLVKVWTGGRKQIRTA